MSDVLLSIGSVRKAFGPHVVLDDVSLEVRPGEFIAMLGPSGCGKTTLLRCIAGFLTPDAGSISIDGEDVTHRPPNRRPLNTVFQSYALFPHMTILDNVAYGPRRQGAGRAEAQKRARDALQMVGLDHAADRYPAQFSGGQQQRVALARAIVNRPKLLLLDEPLSALDLKLRKRMQMELKQLQQRLGIAFVFVTHDQDEAMAMADRIVVMNSGRIEQIGSGGEIYRAPLTRFVADFIGEANFIECAPDVAGALRTAIGSLPLPSATHPSPRLTAVIRPEHLAILSVPDPAYSTAAGVVEDVIDSGAHVTTIVRVQDQLLVSRHGNGVRPSRGQAVLVGFRPGDVSLVGG